MGRQESSTPRPRQRVRRHRHRRHPPSEPIEPRAVLESLSHGPQETHTHARVEKWLGQVAAPALDTGLRPANPQRSGVPSLGRAAELADPLWRPRHIPPDDDAALAAFLPTTDRQGKSKRRRRYTSDDSSLIQDLAHRTEDTELGDIHTSTRHGSAWRREPLRDVSACPNGGYVASTSSSSASPQPHNYEKRPRHKTKEDKYDTKKPGVDKHAKKSRKVSSAHEEHGHSRSKKKRRKAITAGKKAMNNFTSEAVSRDRITVHPTLKPGLFDNKREPKRGPIPDLSFSDMDLVRHQKRDAPQAKSVSKSQLRDLRRRSQELEQISSFFTRDKKEARSQPRQAPRGMPKRHADVPSETPIPLHDEALSHGRERTADLMLPLSDGPGSTVRQHTVGCASRSLSSSLPAEDDHGRASSKATTYFTWSSSQHPGQDIPHGSDKNADPGFGGSARSDTPESVRRALVATGVFRNTNIRPYDEPVQIQHETAEATDHNASRGLPQDIITSKHNPSVDRNAEIYEASILKNVRRRWKTILPPEWTSQSMSQATQPQSNNLKEARALVSPTISLGAELADRPRSTSIAFAITDQKNLRFHASPPLGKLDSGSNDDHALERGRSSSRNSNVAKCDEPDNQDRVSITSREAMPPPPRPQPKRIRTRPTALRPDSHLSPTAQIVTLDGLKPSSGPTQDGGPGSLERYATAPASDSCFRAEESWSRREPASWIPRIVTPVASALDGEEAVSNNVHSGIYRTHSGRQDLSETTLSTGPLTNNTTESMTDFIARIESEIELQEYPSYYEESASGPTYEQRTSLYERTREEAPVLSNRIEGSPEIAWKPPIHSRLKQVPEALSSMEDCAIEAVEEAFGADARSSGGPNVNGDISEDFLEMSKFWRPNQFSQI